MKVKNTGFYRLVVKSTNKTKTWTIEIFPPNTAHTRHTHSFLFPTTSFLCSHFHNTHIYELPLLLLLFNTHFFFLLSETSLSIYNIRVWIAAFWAPWRSFGSDWRVGFPLVSVSLLFFCFVYNMYASVFVFFVSYVIFVSFSLMGIGYFTKKMLPFCSSVHSMLQTDISRKSCLFFFFWWKNYWMGVDTKCTFGMIPH